MISEHENRIRPNYASVIKMWGDFIENRSELQQKKIPESYYFCDNQKDADECADLVVKGIKQATASSLNWCIANKIEISQIGDLFIITNWDGIAKAIVEITRIAIKPFNKITAKFAEIEGEGDKSLAYWKKTHKVYYCREQTISESEFDDTMMIVCEYFKIIYPKI